MKPIAWYDPTNGMVSTDKNSPLFTPLGQVLPLYTQRTWAGLTDDEPMQIWDGIIKYAPSEMRIKDFAKAIEAKLKEKNT